MSLLVLPCSHAVEKIEIFTRPILYLFNGLYRSDIQSPSTKDIDGVVISVATKMAAVQRGPAPAHEINLPTQQLPRLHFNRGKNVDLSSTGWMLHTPVDTPLEVMRKRYDDTGYLWVKNLLPREAVYEMREQYV